MATLGVSGWGWLTLTVIVFIALGLCSLVWAGAMGLLAVNGGRLSSRGTLHARTEAIEAAGLTPFTPVLMSWRRPASVIKLTRDLLTHPAVVNVIVVGANPDHRYAAPLDALAGNPEVLLLRTNHDPGLHIRFAAALMSVTEAVWIQDDDLQMEHATLTTMAARWTAAPKALHGLYGRYVAANGSYNFKRPAGMRYPAGRAPIILTQGVMTSRALVAHFFQHIQAVQPLAARVRPYFNGEDIVHALAAYAASGQLGYIHKDLRAGVKVLPQPYAISSTAAHTDHRSAMCRAMLQANSALRALLQDLHH